ncbi:MAG TPA: flavodoxin family protein [Methanothrix sp.]|jgi:multimeric flavodoxin WrbA|uniref:flavodoxin family protein n=2 Tax=Methanothrix sp. TaxID=90426 RepID=UPI002D171CF7|nr:flavodoxin family protein [Methanothrix sp.]MDI9417692.1 flavodoxin family protein [Euryarchaeota archaeon]HON36680.1 flavodoxin family protein [Methanothrix sp.]HRU75921.1 flavodoxin family protein [Methanothrix sp.]
MKALGIVGSPRRNGNVDTLVSKVLEGAQEAGLETSKYILNEMNYSGCQACEYCKSHDHCRLDDDLTELFAEMKEADAVVFGSPIYFFLFSGQFKLMQDRMYSLIDAAFVPRLRPGKRAIIVTSQGNADVASYAKAADDFALALKMLGFELKDIIRMVDGIAPDAALARKDMLDMARSAGAALGWE